MTALYNLPITELRAGDFIISDKETVVVDLVEDVLTEHGLVRYHGRILRGYGKSSVKVHTWSFPPEQTLDVERP